MATGGAPKKESFFKRFSRQFTSAEIAAVAPPAAPPAAAPQTSQKGSVIKRLSMRLLGGVNDAQVNKATAPDLDALLEVQLATPWRHKLSGFQQPPAPDIVIPKEEDKQPQVKPQTPILTRHDSMIELDVIRVAKPAAKKS